LKRRLLIGLAALGVCVVVLAVFLPRKSEGPLYQGKTISTWAYQLFGPGPETRDQAATVLKGLGTNAVPGLIRLLEWRDPIWRKQLWALALRLPPRFRRGLLAHSPVPHEQTAHQAAAMALTIIGPQANGAVAALGRDLRLKEPANLWHYADALGAIGKDSLPVLTNALASTDPAVRSAALFGLVKLGPAAEPAVPALVQRLKDNNAEVRTWAVRSLAAVGPPAVPALVAAVEHERGPVRQGAAEALMSLDVPWRSVEPALLGMLQDADPASRRQAIATLGVVRARDERAILAIAAALKDPEIEVRVEAANGLGEVSWKAQPAVPALIEALKDGSVQVRSNAAKTLGMIGPPAKAAEPALTNLARDSDLNVSSAAKEALLKIQTGQGRGAGR
jgi:HEAT repeat protein